MKTPPLIILGSARKNSDTKKLCDILFAKDEMELIDLLNCSVAPYNYEGNYPTGDNFLQICDTILNHNVIVFATPVYWYAMSGHMKLFFDRLSDLVTLKKEIGRKLKGKKMFLISVSSETTAPEGFEVPFRLSSVYLGMEFVAAYHCPTEEVNVLNWEGREFLEKIKADNLKKKE